MPNFEAMQVVMECLAFVSATITGPFFAMAYVLTEHGRSLMNTKNNTSGKTLTFLLIGTIFPDQNL